MLIGIISDTHDNVPRTRDAVARFNSEHVELVLHAGDVIAPFMIETFRDLSAPLIGVFGNNDGDRELLMKRCSQLPRISFKGSFARFEAGGISIGLTHGTDRDLLDVLVAGNTFDLLVYGHTHNPDIRTAGKTLIVNPGETCGYLTGKSTIALVETSRRKAEIIGLP